MFPSLAVLFREETVSCGIVGEAHLVAIVEQLFIYLADTQRDVT